MRLPFRLAGVCIVLIPLWGCSSHGVATVETHDAGADGRADQNMVDAMADVWTDLTKVDAAADSAPKARDQAADFYRGDAGREDAADPALLYTAGGKVVGLTGVLVLQLTAGGHATSSLTVMRNGEFTFDLPLTDGSPYRVSIVTPPAGQTCRVAREWGVITGVNATAVDVSCTTWPAAYLTGLHPSTGTLTPAFTPTDLAYAVEVGLQVSSLTITPTATRETTITVDGMSVESGTASAPVALNIGETVLHTTASSEGATSTTYSLTARRGRAHYLKASQVGDGENVGPSPSGAHFGSSIATWGDLLVVGAPYESVGGAVYVFARSGASWHLQKRLKASNARPGARFGHSVAVFGTTLAVGSISESSAATGVDNDQNDTSCRGAGAVYVFEQDGTNWTQSAYLKASNTQEDAQFGWSVALSAPTLVVGANHESSGARGVDGDPYDKGQSARSSGAAYVFGRNGATWTQRAYLKASNARAWAVFACSLAISERTLVVGAAWEASSAKGVNGDETDASALHAGAAYVFEQTGNTWKQEAYLKASNTRAGAKFGDSVAISGPLLVVGSPGETSRATGINSSDPSDANITSAGAAYAFMRKGATWVQQLYLKPSNVPQSFTEFGRSVAVAGSTIVIGAAGEGGGPQG